MGNPAVAGPQGVGGPGRRWLPRLSAAQWWRLARPPTLPASVVPVCVGTAAALVGRLPVSAPAVALMFAVALLLQAATNMANEYYDFKSGLDDASSRGIAGVLVRGETGSDQVRAAFVWTFAAALAAGCALAALRGWVLLPVGGAAIAVGYLYSSGPRPLSGTPLGEASVFVVMGVAEVAISEFAAGRHLSWGGLAASLPVACTVAAILLGNNLRDRSADAARGRRTLAVRMGLPGAARLLVGVLAAGLLGAPLLAAAHLLPAGACLTLLALPGAWGLGRRMLLHPSGDTGNPVPALGRLHLLSGMLLTAGLLLSLAR